MLFSAVNEALPSQLIQQEFTLNYEEKAYLDLCMQIINTGEERVERTGTL